MIQSVASGTPLYSTSLRRRGIQVQSSPGGGGGGGFDPSSIAGLSAWFKADAGTSTTTDGVAVSQWNDQSAGAHNATQATGASQPLYKAAVQNGLPGVLFDGVNDFMDATGVVVAQPNTTFVAFRATTIAAGKNVLDGITTRQAITQAFGGGPHWSMYAGTDVDGVATTDLNAHQISAVFNGASSTAFLDGTADITGNAGANGLSGLRIGAFTSTGALWPGYVFEVLIYNSALSTLNRQAVETYIRGRWATP